MEIYQKNNILCTCYQMTKEDIINDILNDLEILAGEACGACREEISELKILLENNKNKEQNNK